MTSVGYTISEQSLEDMLDKVKRIPFHRVVPLIAVHGSFQKKTPEGIPYRVRQNGDKTLYECAVLYGG